MRETSSQREAAGLIVLLCGLPASGKSTLSRQLLEDGAHRLLETIPLHFSRVSMRHVSFDGVLARLMAGRNVVSFDPELWHEARQLVLTATRSYFFAAPDSRADSVLSGLSSERTAVRSESTNGARGLDVILLDDNMHYRSMRKCVRPLDLG